MQLAKSLSKNLSHSLSRSLAGGGGIAPYKALLTAQGDGTGVATLRIQSSEDTVLTIEGTGRFYTDSNGTLDESTTWNVTAGALRTIYIRQATGTSNLVFTRPDLIIRIGSQFLYGWSFSNAATSPGIELSPVKYMNLISLNLYYRAKIFGGLPNKLEELVLQGDVLAWTYTGTLPAELTYLRLSGNLINWTYEGALPAGLTYLRWSGDLINWTYTQIDGTSTFTGFTLSNFRITKLTSVEMVTLLTSMTNKVGGFPTAIGINDYADYASPPQEVIDAVALFKSTKGVTTVSLGA